MVRTVRLARSAARSAGAGMLGAAALAAASCVGVDLERAGERVALREPGEIAASCQKIGIVNTRVWVGFRSDERVASELATLARNQAGEIGGDTIAASSPVSEGKQSFDVYRCSVS
jgi:hypothetical protein